MKKLLKYVPAYDWTGNCTYTADAMMYGYYDIHGYDLFEPTRWENLKETDVVSDEIYNKTEKDDAVSDFFQEGYAEYKGYDHWNVKQYIPDKECPFSLIKREIDSNRPVIFHVNTNVETSVHHSVTVIGYDDETQELAVYDTWSDSEDNVRWIPCTIDKSVDWYTTGVFIYQPGIPDYKHLSNRWCAKVYYASLTGGVPTYRFKAAEQFLYEKYNDLPKPENGTLYSFFQTEDSSKLEKEYNLNGKYIKRFGVNASFLEDIEINNISVKEKITSIFKKLIDFFRRLF